MCAPVLMTGLAKLGTTLSTTLGSLSTALTVGSGVVGAVTAVQQGKANAAAAAATARAQEQSARETLQQGKDEADRRRRAGAALQAEQSVGLAANGVDLGSAAALDMLGDTKRLVEEDAFAIRENSRRAAAGLSQGAANSLAEAKSQRSAGKWGAIDTILTTGAKVGAKYSSWAAEKYGAKAQGAF